MKRQQETSAARDNSKFRISDAGRCRLMRYWKRQGKAYDPVDMPANVLRSLQVGTLFHEWIERIAQESQYAVLSEQPLEDEHRLGHYDLLLTLCNSTQILYDVKTMNGRKAYFMVEKGKGPGKHPIYQLCTYAEMLPTTPDRQSLVYINRDTLDIHEFPIHYQSFQMAVHDDWSILITAWNTNTPPEPNPETWECHYCIYKNECEHR